MATVANDVSGRSAPDQLVFMRCERGFVFRSDEGHFRSRVFAFDTAEEAADWLVQQYGTEPKVERKPVRPLRLVTHEDAVVEATAAALDLSRSLLVSPRRTATLVQARRVAILAMHNLGSPSTAIGRALGRDHTTILHSVRKAESLYNTNRSFREMVDSIVASARPGGEA